MKKGASQRKTNDFIDYCVFLNASAADRSTICETALV